MEELPPDGGKQLLDIYKQLPGNLKRGQDRTVVDKLRHNNLQRGLSSLGDRVVTKTKPSLCKNLLVFGIIAKIKHDPTTVFETN